ncbi:MAG: replication initiation protein [Lewinellaceae bacterium]|nr:replication initiation protein [Saprospiraceae bacterium]MCB9341676.1 replication initiation protein [Lewinellaceae bacterium]
MKKSKRKANKGIVLIKKANDLIESRYKFDVWETRFFLTVLAQIRRDDEEFQEYRIWYKDVIKTFGLKSGDSYALLRGAAKSLMGKSFFVSYEENGVERERQYHILREVDYMKSGQEEKGKIAENHEYIDVVVEKKMKPFLLQLQRNFTAYDLKNVVKLGVYPVRVYELLKQYQTFGKRTFKVVEMKRMFELNDQYKLFGDFFRWVITPSVKQINKYTDLFITNIEKIKEGRRVVALRFHFYAKSEEMPPSMEESRPTGQLKLPMEVETEDIHETEKDRLFNQYQPLVVEKFGVTPSVFLNLLEGRTEAQIEQAINVTNRAKFNQEIKSSVSGFFVKALKEGYTDQKEEVRKKEMKEQIERERNFKINERIKEITSEDPTITNRAVEALNRNPALKVFVERKSKSLGRPLELDDYRNDRTLRDLIKGMIIELAKSQFLDIDAEFDNNEI